MAANRLRRDEGSALIEFAATSLLFFMFVFAIVEGSRAIYQYHTLSSVAREGTRFAAVRGAGSGRMTTEDAVRAYVRSKSSGVNPAVTVTWTPASKLPGGTVEVYVTHTFTTLVPLAGIGNISMSARARGIVLD